MNKATVIQKLSVGAQGDRTALQSGLRAVALGEGFAEYAGTPVGNLTPATKGEWCLDTTNGVYYRSQGLTSSDWYPIGASLLGDELTSLDISLVCESFDDFLGDVIDANWGVNKGADAACVDFAHLAGAVSGQIQATMGAGAGASMAANGVQLHSALQWKANQGGLIWESRVKMSAITNVALFVGLTDQIASLEMPATLGGSDALTTNATDAVGVLFDTGADTDNWFLVGVANDVDATKQNTALAPVADTFETWRIELSSAGVATFKRNGTTVGTTMSGAVTATVALTPVIAGFTRAAATRTVQVDYIKTRALRA